MSEADTLFRFAASGEYSASEEAIFTAAANEIRMLRRHCAALAQALNDFVCRVEALTPGIDGMFQIAQLHGAAWRPEDNWVAEKAHARRVLDDYGAVVP